MNKKDNRKWGNGSETKLKHGNRNEPICYLHNFAALCTNNLVTGLTIGTDITATSEMIIGGTSSLNDINLYSARGWSTADLASTDYYVQVTIIFF